MRPVAPWRGEEDEPTWDWRRSRRGESRDRRSTSTRVDWANQDDFVDDDDSHARPLRAEDGRRLKRPRWPALGFFGDRFSLRPPGSATIAKWAEPKPRSNARHWWRRVSPRFWLARALLVLLRPLFFAIFRRFFSNRFWVFRWRSIKTKAPTRTVRGGVERKPLIGRWGNGWDVAAGTLVLFLVEKKWNDVRGRHNSRPDVNHQGPAPDWSIATGWANQRLFFGSNVSSFQVGAQTQIGADHQGPASDWSIADKWANQGRFFDSYSVQIIGGLLPKLTLLTWPYLIEMDLI